VLAGAAAVGAGGAADWVGHSIEPPSSRSSLSANRSWLATMSLSTATSSGVAFTSTAASSASAPSGAECWRRSMSRYQRRLTVAQMKARLSSASRVGMASLYIFGGKFGKEGGGGGGRSEKIERTYFGIMHPERFHRSTPCARSTSLHGHCAKRHTPMRQFAGRTLLSFAGSTWAFKIYISSSEVMRRAVEACNFYGHRQHHKYHMKQTSPPPTAEIRAAAAAAATSVAAGKILCSILRTPSTKNSSKYTTCCE